MSNELSPRESDLVSSVFEAFNPVSVFLYGSRARGDAKSNSDYEIGILYKKDKKIARQDLAAINPHDDINLYPFCYEDILEHKIDTPFPPTLFLYELTSGGAYTLAGEHIIESLEKPKINGLHVVARTNFDVAMALAAMLTNRAGDTSTANELFVKSCLFGARNTLVLEDRVFPLQYKDIYQGIQQKDLGDHQTVVEKAFALRENTAELSTVDFYKNIAFLTRFVREQVAASADQDTNYLT